MKIAWTISAQTRYVEECAVSQLAVIERLRNRGYTVDIYCHCYEDAELVQQVYQPVSTVVTDDFVEQIKQLQTQNDVHFRYVGPQHFALCAVIDSIPQPEQYDWIVKSRYDIVFDPARTTREIVDELGQRNSTANILAPVLRFEGIGFWNDIFYLVSGACAAATYNTVNLQQVFALAQSGRIPNLEQVSPQGIYALMHTVSWYYSEVHQCLSLRETYCLRKEFHQPGQTVTQMQQFEKLYT